MRIRVARGQDSHVAHAVRVAAVATLLIACVYVAVTVVYDVVDSHRLVANVDTHLNDRLADAVRPGRVAILPGTTVVDRDVEDAPVLLWKVDRSGRTVALTVGAPHLPEAAGSRWGTPSTVRIGSISFRLRAVKFGESWLVAGQSLTPTDHVQAVLAAGEAIAGLVLIVAVFLGALVIGLMAAGPVEQARRRQLEFTADASHELRTPLSVIEAEVSLALRSRREGDQYREALERVSGESQRLRRIVDDLLWLARFDSQPSPPKSEPIDLLEVAQNSAERFRVVANEGAIVLDVRPSTEAGAWISAPYEWLDRLAGVLLDNACRYAGRGGRVVISVAAHGNRVSLAVEDSGPGIPPQERPRLFDRFHRDTDEGTGAGLGLAIGDAVVRSTGGRWLVGDSKLGGARMEVSWYRLHNWSPSEKAPVAEPGSARSDDRTPVAP